MNNENEETMNENYEQKILADVNAIFTLMAKRVDESQMKLLHEAYDFAAFAHKGQLRKSGEPYISHPVAVARILKQKSWNWVQTLLWQHSYTMFWKIVHTA